MSENSDSSKFQLLSEGQESTAIPVASWYELLDTEKLKGVKEFDGDEPGIFEDETGRAYRVDFRKQAEGTVNTIEKLPEFANIVAITSEEKAKLIKLFCIPLTIIIHGL